MLSRQSGPHSKNRGDASECMTSRTSVLFTAAIELISPSIVCAIGDVSGMPRAASELWEVHKVEWPVLRHL